MARVDHASHWPADTPPLTRPAQKNLGGGDSPGAAAPGGLDQDPLDLIQADRIVGAIMERRRARRLVVRDLPCVLYRTIVLFTLSILRSPPSPPPRVAAASRLSVAELSELQPPASCGR